MENMEELVGKNILVTGGAGFIGAHLVELLLQKKYRVTVIDIQNPIKSYFFLNHLDKKADYRIIDITKKRQVENVFAAVRPSYVIHLAALSTVLDSYDNPFSAFKTNVMGTVNILESCRSIKGIQGVIVASSDKAYGKTNKPYTEKFRLKGDHPYDVSKSCEDLIAQTYAKTYGMPIIITRFGNVYGEGDIHTSRIVPGICLSLITKTPLKIRSDGTYVRDYVYVKDVVLAYVFLLKHIAKASGQAFNVSSEDNLSVFQLIRKSEKILKQKIYYSIANTVKNEIPYQHLNDAKIRKLGWKPKFQLGRGLRATFAWYKKNYAFNHC